MSANNRAVPGAPLSVEKAAAAASAIASLAKVQSALGDELWRSTKTGLTEPKFLPAVAVNYLAGALFQMGELLGRDTIRSIVRDTVPWLFEDTK